MATRNAILMDRCNREQAAMSSKRDLVRVLRTRFRSQAEVGDLICRNRIPMPLMNLHVVGWSNTEYLSIGWWKAVIVTR